MKRCEYRIELLKFSRGRSQEDQLMEVLNRFGQEGWRFNRIQCVLVFPFFSWNLKLLLEREIAEET
jgi:hypothetical protein